MMIAWLMKKKLLVKLNPSYHQTVSWSPLVFFKAIFKSSMREIYLHFGANGQRL
jgi:hypothetical protein